MTLARGVTLLQTPPTRSTTKNAIYQDQRCSTNRDCGYWFFFNERRYAIQRITVGFSQLTSCLMSRTFSFHLRITNQFSDRALRLAGQLFCNTFYLFTLHNSPNLHV
ncbi:hypothetical protein PS870_03961 [Pseudomonas fluorescens]|uniref:Uncharacterized protein n=1 Tax=Pseudomonas fluorescens TaxID=294 RepID=A0A5E7MGC0_PSEFL|nr:hypothetical protein PS870_03961 [Pseudomonas fluorescens]